MRPKQTSPETGSHKQIKGRTTNTTGSSTLWTISFFGVLSLYFLPDICVAAVCSTVSARVLQMTEFKVRRLL